jgi:ribonuclease HII
MRDNMDIFDSVNMTVGSIKELIKNANIEEYEKIKAVLLKDKRSGVIKIAEDIDKKIQNHNKEIERLNNMMLYEEALYNEDYNYIAGVDEAGRGPLAGPVASAAVILPRGLYIEGLNDSKKVSVKRREELFDIIIDKAIAYNISLISNEVIDSINILNATKLSMKNSVEGLKIKPDFVLVDAVTIPAISQKQKGIIKGDAKSVSIAAASILAKVTRDRLMQEYHKKYPEYNFSAHKGYGTSEHVAAIKAHGICDIHRKSFLSGILNI